MRRRVDPLEALQAFYGEHRRCGDLDGDVEDLPSGGYRVWMTCTCGARVERREPPRR